MKRSIGFSKVYASASVVAISTLLYGCSQPASYATVDLSGSYGGGVQPQYSATTGLPVYQSTQVYTDPYGNSLPQSYAPQTQVAQSYVPGNQVASLDPTIGYNSIVQQSYPAQTYASPVYNAPAYNAPVYSAQPYNAPAYNAQAYSAPAYTAQTVAPAPMLTTDTVLSSDGFVSVGQYRTPDTYGTQTAFLAPGAGSMGLPAPAPQVQQPVYQSAPEPEFEPLTDQSFDVVPPTAAAPMIESAPLPDAYDAPAVFETETLPEPDAWASPDYGSVSVEPLATDPMSIMSAPAQQFAGIQRSLPPRENVDEVIDYYGLADRAADPVVQEVKLPSPTPVAPAPAPTLQYSAPAVSGNIAIPTASEQYLRPYEALPPGFYPPLDQQAAGDLVSFAAPQAAPEAVFEPAPQFVALQPSEMSDLLIQEASTVSMSAAPVQHTSLGGQYTVVSGDTLSGISRNYGVDAKAIADANGIDMGAPIYVGDTLSIPAPSMMSGGETLSDAPIVVLQSANASGMTTERQPGFLPSGVASNNFDMVDIEELARYFKEANNGDGFNAMPMISAEAGEAMRGRAVSAPTEYISNPQQAMAYTPQPVAISAPVSTPVTASTQTYVPDVMPTYQSGVVPMEATASGYAWPVQGDVFRLSEGQIEIEAPAGTTVSASAAGRVVHVEDGPRGVLVVIEHNDGWRSLTLGVQRPRVVQGQIVKAGTPIGEASSQRVRFELRDTQAKIADSLGALRS